ncbi:hypothetical protein [Bauldia sp.]|uniref:hypothetical protein n=1 Tax=Bauldia sp. TaxID=2575872 RepID=UPI003BAB7E58
MRDISIDLRERLEAAEKAKSDIDAEYRQRVASLETEITAIRSLLDIEAKRSGRRSIAAPAPAMPIKEFMIATITESGPKTKTELRDIADRAGYFAAGENPGRTTHGHTLSLVRQGRLTVKDDKYHLPSPDTAGHEKGPEAATSEPSLV